MENKRILVLCGGKFAFPALQQLGFEKFLCGVAVGNGSAETIAVLENKSRSSGLHFRSFPDRQSISGLRSWLDELKPDYIFSISFPFLIPADVLSYSPQSFINFHPGPLPAYRGPMPLFEVLRYGEETTAVSVHFMNAEFDKGPIILEEPVAIHGNETYGMLALRLSARMADISLNVAHMLQFGSTIPSREQLPHQGRYFEKPRPEDTFIRWDRMPAKEILALVRACNPWNQGADSLLLGEAVKIISASFSNIRHDSPPGTVLGCSENGQMAVACAAGETVNIDIISCDAGILSAATYFELRKTLIDRFSAKKPVHLHGTI